MSTDSNIKLSSRYDELMEKYIIMFNKCDSIIKSKKEDKIYAHKLLNKICDLDKKVIEKKKKIKKYYQKS